MTWTYTASLWGGQGLPPPVKNCYDNKSSLLSYERQTWPTPQPSHHRGSVLSSHPFLTWAVPVSAPLVPLCLSFLPCACAVTPALPQAYQENWWNNVCEVFSFARMKGDDYKARAVLQRLQNVSKLQPLCLLNCRTTRRIKAVSPCVDCCSGGLLPPPGRNPEERDLPRLWTQPNLKTSRTMVSWNTLSRRNGVNPHSRHSLLRSSMKAGIKHKRQPWEEEMQTRGEKVVSPRLFLPQKPAQWLTKVGAACVTLSLGSVNLLSHKAKGGGGEKQN